MFMKLEYFILGVLLFLVSCSKMNDLHQEYLDQGEIIYPGKADSVQLISGNQRVLLKWQTNADPKLRECLIYWNNRADSLVVSLEKGVYKWEAIIEDLEEGDYLFELINYDAEGNNSIVSEQSGYVYGEKYRNRLQNRLVSISIDQDGSELGALNFHWQMVGVDDGVILNYINGNDEAVTVSIPADVEHTIITDWKPKSVFSYSTLYMPEEDALDTFAANPVSVEFPSAPAWSAYNSIAQTIPGTIDGVYFDVGGNGAGYYDSTSGNSGDAVIRDEEDVDVGNAVSGWPYIIGWIANGEWLNYTVDVLETATYEVDLAYVNNGGNVGGAFVVSFDGMDKELRLWGPKTSGGSRDVEITETGQTIELQEGRYTMKVTMDNPGMNLSAFIFKKVTE
ncbi:DUF4998 domain-containing protein [Sunxiuqinia sp. sy24]|uniref:DUF4998 domain-containing protein n=1 Tax=Sunxiuqinia sp. sy24 TaxID=3461495 RepID=UPI0040457D65